ncbi:MAG: hypothetical protein ABSC32_02850 [Steroidobacteraceae bacterium]|jgi:hypothetical protein
MRANSVVRETAGIVRAVGAAICCCLIAGFAAAGDAPKPGSAAASSGAELDRKLAMIIPGRSTKAQVVALLGQPWRTVQYNDLETVEDEIWEYRGTDAQGPFRVHIEFDRREVVHIVGKIPDRGSGTTGIPARSAAPPPTP